MSGKDKICIIHTEGIQGDILELTDLTWKKILQVSSERLSSFKKSKYSFICKSLPKEYERNKHGYHRTCYKHFTAVKKTVSEALEASTSTLGYTLRSDNRTGFQKSLPKTCIFEKLCIFCGLKRKKFKGMEEGLGKCETKDAEISIKHAANLLKDHTLLLKIADEDFVAKEVCYHHSCRKTYLKSASLRKIENTQEEINETSPKMKQQKHNRAFDKTVNYVTEYIIKPSKAQKLSSVHSRHCVYLSEEGIEDPVYSAQKLLEKLLSHFGDTLKTTKSSNKQGTTLYSHKISATDAEALANDYSSKIESQVEEVALYLRKQIFTQSVCPKLTQPLNFQEIIFAETKVPELLELFFNSLYSGSSKPTNEKIKRRVSSSVQDAIFNASNGRLKPRKHLLLGLGMKSLTGSRKILEILNHLGHCIGYHTSEELETDFALSLMEHPGVTPENISRQPGLVTGLAWDNFDSNLETLSGKGSLHDTFGICYQYVECKESENPSMQSTTHTENAETHNEESRISLEHLTATCKPRRKVRSLDIESKVLEPYPKKPKLVKPLPSLVKSCSNTYHLEDTLLKDFIWMVSVKWSKMTPMWAGWNAKVVDDTSVKQKIGYMRNVTLPPTRNDVVMETLKVSQQVAAECGETSILVHYDLAVAKPAIMIQNQESPRFDNIFICFGSFHIELAYFGALGYYLQGSGIEHILSESGVLASGSVVGFLRGKHFNRCKRIHILLSLALEICLFQKFMENYSNSALLKELHDQIEKLNKNLSQESLEIFIETSSIKQMQDDFNAFKEQTRSGLHGKTAQFYQQYIDLVTIYKYFSRAYRTNNLEMYTYALEKMIPAFFSGKRLNYARWMTIYLVKLLNIGTESPDIKHALSQGGLGIKRSTNSFSRVPVDMALEQTVNADAASRFTGITAFANSESARSRWMITRSLRSEIVGRLLESSGIIKAPDSKHDLEEGRIKKDHRDIERIISALNSFSNPFEDMDPQTPLRNISTGQTVSEGVTVDLLSFSSKGENAARKFKELYIEDPKNIEKPIPRNLINNCASAIPSSKLNREGKKLEVTKCTLDAFAKVIHMAADKNNNLSKVMEYPLTPVPFSLAQIGGLMNKTDKSKLMHRLEKFQRIDKDEDTNTGKPHIDIAIYDAMFLLHTLKMPETYGALAYKLLEIAIHSTPAREVHILFDTYGNQTIKDCEHERRLKVPTVDITVTGADQKTPKKSVDAFRNEQFKTSLIRFLYREWNNNKYASILGNKILYVGVETRCFKYVRKDHNVEVSEVLDLACKHQEADTRIMWHIHHSLSSTDQRRNILVRANDTDVLVLLIYHQKHFKNSIIWFDCGVSSNNSRRMINVTCITEQLGDGLVESLPAYHAFTGLDFTAAFARQGKIRPFEIILKNHEYQKSFSHLGESLSVRNVDIVWIEKFVCAMYGKAGSSSLSDVRYSLFMKKTIPKCQSKTLFKVKGIDPTMLPPSKPALLQKIKRTNAIAWLWKRAVCQNPSDGFDPCDHGWYLESDTYHIHWYDGPTLPEDLEPTTEKDSDTEDEDSDLYSDESDIFSYDSSSDESCEEKDQ